VVVLLLLLLLLVPLLMLDIHRVRFRRVVWRVHGMKSVLAIFNAITSVACHPRTHAALALILSQGRRICRSRKRKTERSGSAMGCCSGPDATLLQDNKKIVSSS